MTYTKTTRSPFHRRKGGMMVLQAFVMILFLAGAAFSVDIAYMHMVKAELRTAVDAASRAGTETLIRTQDAASAIGAAQQVSEQNPVAGDGLTLSNSDIQLGAATQQGNGRFQFTPGGGQLNSVSVVGRRTGQAPDGRVTLFFGNIFGSPAFEPVLDSIAASSVRDIALILDRSGSMLETLGGSDGTKTRFEALTESVGVFLNEIQATSPNARISLTTYSTVATRDIPLTSNFGSVQLAVAAISPNGSTNIFEGLAFGSESLEQDPNQRNFADKTIILMTDGNFNAGGTPIPSAILASSRNHIVHTITFSDGADQTTMQSVAEVGAGMHIHADDAGDLRNAFREIANTLSVSLIQ